MKQRILRIVNIVSFLLCSTIVIAQTDSVWRWEKPLREYQHADSIQAPEAGVNLFVGSSSITIWKEMSDNFPGYPLLNRGFGGSTFKDLLLALDRVVFPYTPGKIFVYEGDNDIGIGISPEEVLVLAKTLREKIAMRMPNVPVVFISVKPSPSRWKMREKYEGFNTALKAYAESTPNTGFVDVWNPMLDTNGIVFKNIFRGDSLHMNSQGYVIWEAAIKPYLVK